MIKYPTDIFKEFMPVISRHGGISVFCAKHNLIKYLGICAHEFVIVEPLCGSDFYFSHPLSGLHPELFKFNPFGI